MTATRIYAPTGAKIRHSLFRSFTTRFFRLCRKKYHRIPVSSFPPFVARSTDLGTTGREFRLERSFVGSNPRRECNTSHVRARLGTREPLNAPFSDLVSPFCHLIPRRSLSECARTVAGRATRVGRARIRARASSAEIASPPLRRAGRRRATLEFAARRGVGEGRREERQGRNALNRAWV